MDFKDTNTLSTPDRHNHFSNKTCVQMVDQIASGPSNSSDKSGSIVMNSGTYCDGLLRYQPQEVEVTLF